MNSQLLGLLPDYGSDAHSSVGPDNDLSHSIARCRWDTVLDDRQKAHQLQEYLSDWSHTVLSGILEQAFQRYCPAGQTWRIGTLELDLGEIDFDELQTELPKRLQAALSEQLKRLLLNTGWQADNFAQAEAQGDAQIVSRAHSLNDYIDSFLRNGIVPWWYTGNQTNLAILLQQLRDAPQEVAAIIRKAGLADAVRKRIAWQYPSSAVKKIVKVLEPYHHGYIVAFADKLVDLQARTQQPKSDRKVFECQSWFWILTHLLVQRGSLFNTMVFVESTLRQMAQHYQLDYRELLQQLVNAAQSLEYKGHSTPQFIQALLGVQQKESVQAEQKSAPEPEQNYWQLFARILLSGQQSVSADGISHMGELFTLLAEENPAKMTELLKKEGQEAKVRQKLAAQLNLEELSRVVFLLAPQNHLFIAAHARQSCEVFASHKNDKQLVWEVILAYLLKNTGSYFNRRQFVDVTLLELSQAQGIDYLMLLDMLSVASITYQGYGQRFELLAILGDLKQQSRAREDKALQIDSVYCQALAEYLATGQAPKVIGRHYLPAPAQLFSWLLHRHPQQLAAVVDSAFNPGSDKSKAFKAGEGRGVSRHTRVRRLLDLIQPADFPIVLRTLDARAANFAGSLTARLTGWQRQQRLPCLTGFDIYYQLYGVMLSVLIGGRASGFTVARFLSAFFAELVSGYGINNRVLLAEIALNVSKDETQNQDSQELLQWLGSQSGSEAEKPNKALSAKGLLAQKIAALWCYLRGDKAGLQRFGLAYDAQTTLSSLVAAIVPGHAQLLLEQLQQQSDSNALAQALLEQADLPPIRQWLGSLWASDDNLAEKSLAQWQKAIASTGLWQGSSTALQKSLHNLFWLSVLDQALTKRGTLSQNDIDALLANVVQLSCQQLQLGLKPLLERLNQKECLNQALLWQKTIVRLAEADAEPVSAFPQDKKIGWGGDIAGAVNRGSAQTADLPFAQDKQRHYLAHPALFGLCQYLLIHGRPPLWLQTSQPLSLQQMISDLVQTKPQLLQRIIKSIQHFATAMFRLHNLLDYQALQAAVLQTKPELKAQLSMLEDFYQGVLQLRFDGIDQDLPTALLRQKTLQAWLSGDWQGLSAQHIVVELSGELMRRHPIPPALIEAEFKRNEQRFPAACRLTVTPELAKPVADQQSGPAANTALKPMPSFPSTNRPVNKSTEQTLKQTMPIHINNAGLVLLQGYIGSYFKRLGLVKDDVFSSEQAQRNAVHCLQYLATGQTVTEEQHLVLNKVLCGLSPSHPVEAGVELAAEDKQTGDSLIEAVINHWPAIGSSSIDGFRGNWLIRAALLSESEDRWDLAIEKRPYDLLLQRIPFRYHHINLPWMTKPLYVTWPT